ncbi:MAG: methyltransferase domain-containing protein [Coriobacteriia bacterium]|nr:methyltransferase domain-containing protein [Coriobacteriia bacterium]
MQEASPGDHAPTPIGIAALNEAEGGRIPLTPALPAWQQDGERRRTQTIVAALALKPGEVFLDVGCGFGGLLIALGATGAELHGVDLAESRLQRASQNIAAHGSRATLHAGSATALPFAREMFSAVCLSEVLEHIPEPDAAIAEARRILVPGGRLVVTVPNQENIRMVTCMHCGEASPLNGHLHSFDCAALAARMEAHGLRVTECRPTYLRVNARPFGGLALRPLPAKAWVALDRRVTGRFGTKGAWLIAVAHTPGG